MPSKSSRSPFLTRFLSDFTLGFADGLTVPFALTAGLSSLGRADTVIFAGLAELCAGSISMGIGGYLAARDELLSLPEEQEAHAAAGDEEELRGMLQDTARSSHGEDSEDSMRRSLDEKRGESRDVPEHNPNEYVIRRHLEPLALSSPVLADILTNLKHQPGGMDLVARRLLSHQESSTSPDSHSADHLLPVWPVASGLSISLGYVIGGLIPLLPYFFASTVGLGLRWSIGLCLVALLVFGSGKSWILHGGRAAGWRRCVWEGVQMLVLGSLAAAAAVLCVTILGASSLETAG